MLGTVLICSFFTFVVVGCALMYEIQRQLYFLTGMNKVLFYVFCQDGDSAGADGEGGRGREEMCVCVGVCVCVCVCGGLVAVYITRLDLVQWLTDKGCEHNILKLKSYSTF